MVVADFDVVFVRESWLNEDDMELEVLDLSIYNIFRRESSLANSESVLLALRKYFSPSLHHQFQTEIEDIWMQLSISNFKLIRFSVHLPAGDMTVMNAFSDKKLSRT